MKAKSTTGTAKIEIKTIDLGGETIETVSSAAEYDRDRRSMEVQLSRFIQDTRERKTLASWVRWVVSIWLGLVMLILLLNGACAIKISDAVAGVLLGTTTLNILGLAYIVLKGLFPESKAK